MFSNVLQYVTAMDPRSYTDDPNEGHESRVGSTSIPPQPL